MTLFVELALLTGVLFIIAYPLMSRHALEPSGAVLTDSDMSDLLYRKEAAYVALKDLEFDHNTGKIDDDDYKAMKTSFEAEALGILHSIENYKKGIVTPSPASPGARSKGKGEKFCSNCGVAVKKAAKFCHECGARL